MPVALHPDAVAEARAARLWYLQQSPDAAAAFVEVETYGKNRPSAGYLRRLLGSDYFITLAALKGNEVVAGIAAYELKSASRSAARSTATIWLSTRRTDAQGVETALIEELKHIAAARGAYVMFVQADIGDDPAIELYTKLGVREDVLHVEIAVTGGGGAA